MDKRSVAELEAEALAQARALVAKKFKEPTSLDEVATMRADYKKKLANAESQLNGVVQAKLDGIKRAMDVVDNSQRQLRQLKQQVKNVEGVVASTNTALSHHPRLKAVKSASKNLQTVVDQVTFFANIPNRVQELLDQLREDPSNLKDVYLQSRKLERWRDQLLEDGKQLQKRAGATPTSPRGRQRASVTEVGLSKAMYEKFMTVMGDYLAIVYHLSGAIRQQLWANIENCYELAENEPALLVMTMEVIELQERLQARLIEQTIQRALAEDKDPDEEVEKLMPEDLKAEALKRLRSMLERRLRESFVARHLEAANNCGHVEATLISATPMLVELTIFKNEIAPCFPPDYDVVKIALEIFEDHIRPQVTSLYEREGELEVSDLLRIIDWLEYYVHQMTVLGHPELRSCLEFKMASRELMNEYLHRIKSQVMNWFDNINKNPMDVVRSMEGTLITSQPEDMFNVIHMQLAVAQEKLPKEHLADVVNGVLQVLREVQRRSYDVYEQDWRKMDVEKLCAAVNDNFRMQEKCDEFSASVLSKIPDLNDGEHATTEVLQEMLEEVSSEYLSLAVTCTRLVAKAVLASDDLHREAYDLLFTPQWEKREVDPMTTVIATLADYCNDIDGWLPKFFYAKFMREAVQIALQMYLKALFNKASKDSFQFTSGVSAGSRMVEDRNTLVEHFQTQAGLLAQAGMREEGAVENAFSLIVHLGHIVSCTHLAVAESDVVAVFEYFGSDGLKKMQSLVGAIPDLQKNERQEYNRLIEQWFFQGGFSTKKGREGAALSPDSQSRRYHISMKAQWSKIQDSIGAVVLKTKRNLELRQSTLARDSTL